jgi:hypothetical protein
VTVCPFAAPPPPPPPEEEEEEKEKEKEKERGGPPASTPASTLALAEAPPSEDSEPGALQASVEGRRTLEELAGAREATAETRRQQLGRQQRLDERMEAHRATLLALLRE